jgi:hypothetical protein
MGGACSTHGARRGAYRVMWETQRKGDHLENIRVGVRIILRNTVSKWVGDGWVGWIYLSQNRDRWRALVNAVMNIWVPQNTGDVLAS